jgi:hypothetical protein
MPEQQIDYGRLVERALRRVVYDALSTVAQHGLPGRHQLYLTFRTVHPGVVIADELRARYPAEMTIVLQHEFWDLQVRPEGFAVTLSFNDRPQRLEVPFEAIIVFADPSVEFGLQFTLPDDQAEEPASMPASLTVVESPPAAPALVPSRAPSKAPSKPGQGDGAEVVALDRFRKK